MAYRSFFRRRRRKWTGGVPTTLTGVPNACAPRAIQAISGKSDQEVIQACMKRNWKPGGGMYVIDYVDVLRDMGFQMKYVPVREEWDAGKVVGRFGYVTRGAYQRDTLAQFVAKNPTGTFLLRTKRHALVVCDGRVIDPGFNDGHKRRAVLGVHQVLNPRTAPAPTKPEPKAPPPKPATVTWQLSDQVWVPLPKRPRKFKPFLEMRGYVAYCHARGFTPTIEQVLANTSYKVVDLRYDLEKGNVLIVRG